MYLPPNQLTKAQQVCTNNARLLDRSQSILNMFYPIPCRRRDLLDGAQITCTYSDRDNNNCRPLSITIMFLLHSSFIHSSTAFAYPPKKYKYFRHSLFIVFTGTLAYLLFPSQYSVTHRRYCSSIYKPGELRWLSNT